MAEVTGIAWTTSSWNPWIGCTKVSPGCDGCYAEALDNRMRWEGKTHWGPGVPRKRTGLSNWQLPLKWNRLQKKLAEANADVGRPKPGAWTVFPSMCDPFDNEVPDEWRRDFWDVIESTPYLTWLILTKRIGNAMHMLRTVDWSASKQWNVWIGASIVNQEEADRDMLKLLAIPARGHFVSYEPALGPVDWSPWVNGRCDNGSIQYADGGRTCPLCQGHGCKGRDRLDWIIHGGESSQPGHKARESKLEWGINTAEQCKAAGVPFFEKQLGSYPTFRGIAVPHTLDRAGADPAYFPTALKIQEFPPELTPAQDRV